MIVMITTKYLFSTAALEKYFYIISCIKCYFESIFSIL